MTDDRFDVLVSHYFDDALDAEGAAELNAFLSKPENARRFVRMSRIHGSLRELQSSAAPAGASTEQILKSWIAPRRPGRQILSYASAALAAAALLALVFLLNPPERLIAPTVGAQGAPEVLLVVGRVDPDLTAGDSLVRDRLVKLGFRVTPVKEDAVTAELATGRALVIISESIRTDPIGGRLARVTVPVMNCEPHLNFALGMSRRQGRPTEHFSKTRRFRVRILSPEHSLAAGLRDNVRVYESIGTLGWGLPDDSAMRIAVCDDAAGAADQVSIFAYEKSAEVQGQRLPARRVSFFLSDMGQEASLLTPDGWKLFDAAVSWLAGR